MKQTANSIRELEAEINQYSADGMQSDSLFPTLDFEQMTPIDFEHYCAGILRNNGWQTKVTKGSGDQGVDIVSEHGDIKAVFQCKKYSNPVGNKAVQEIIAGKHFEQADFATVVSNAQFTASAKQIANIAGVKLLHYSELDNFARELKYLENW
ncbi:MAG: restriction endonuclease [Methyloglobulus sp.]|nr:restriction endonuclease [Methyloglobulus sp.]